MSRVSRRQAWRKQRVSMAQAWRGGNYRVSNFFLNIVKTWRAEGCASSAQAWRKHFRSCAEGAKGWRKLRASYAQAPWKNYWKGTAGGRVAQAVRKLPRKALGRVFENPGARKVAQAMRKSCVSESWGAERLRKQRVSFFIFRVSKVEGVCK